jgi:Holliday junction resolvase RusA-like endonuclease
VNQKPLFVVELKSFEPHTVHSGKGHKNIKKQLHEAILQATDGDEIGAAREKFRDKALKIEIEFRLWKGTQTTTNTRAKKDLDNLLKPVLDVLQTSLNTQKTEPGLDLIEGDEAVYEINARKIIVDDEQEEGIRIVVLEHRPSVRQTVTGRWPQTPS